MFTENYSIVPIMIEIFCVIERCSSIEVHGRFTLKCRFHLQGKDTSKQQAASIHRIITNFHSYLFLTKPNLRNAINKRL
jgi:hypothetical protein